MTTKTINKLDRPVTRPISRPATIAEETEFITVGLVEQFGKFVGVSFRRESMTRDAAWERNLDFTGMRWEEIRE